MTADVHSRGAASVARTDPAGAATSGGALVGTGGLIRLILRRDRVLLPIWILWLSLIPVGFVSATENLYPTVADRLGYAATSGTNPTFLALYGPLYSTSAGGIVTQRVGFIPVVLALISILTVIRHTRAEEEAGRRELLGATVVGRHAGLAAALIVTIAANLVLGAILALGMAKQGQPADGSIAIGFAFAVTGCVFAAVAGIAAQLSASAGTARGIAIGLLGLAFVIRLAGDVGGAGNGLSWLSWLSPIGWAHRIRPFADERWWILALAAGLVAVLLAAAVTLSARRDVDAGVLPPRLGPASAAPGLRTPLALAWRLHRGLLLGWAVGLGCLGLVWGSVADSVKDLLEDNRLKDIFLRVGGQSGIVDAFMAGVMGLTAMIVSAYAVQATLRLRSEESSLHAEPVLATPVGRLRWATSHLAFAAGGPLLALAVCGLFTGLVYGLVTGDVGRELPRMLGGAMVQLPAVWLLAGIALALFGLAPRFASAAWGALAVFLLLGEFGAALQFDQWMLNLSPFTHIPKLPGAEVSATPLVWLVGITAVLAAAGLAGFRRRNIG